MRNLAVVSMTVLVGVLAFSPVVSAQNVGSTQNRGSQTQTLKELTPGPGWLTCPRCQNNLQVRAARDRYKVEGHSFDRHDISGIWGNNGINLDFKTVPELTPYGKQLHEATQTTIGPTGLVQTNEKDGMLICDPLGFPRWWTYNYGLEFVMLPDRVLQFFEWGHTWRTIWTDGRKLPTDPPTPRWLGYAVGRWEGDTFIVESNGYDDRSWLDQDRRTMQRGMPHSDEMRVEERYRLTAYDTLEATITIVDPKVYTKPWTTGGKYDLRPGTELWEYFCVPSDSNEYNDRLIKAGTGAK